MKISILQTNFSHSESTLLIKYLINPNLKYKNTETKCVLWKKHIELKRYLSK